MIYVSNVLGLNLFIYLFFAIFRCPEEITVSDVYSAVKKVPKFDMFSLSGLGGPKDMPGNT